MAIATYCGVAAFLITAETRADPPKDAKSPAAAPQAGQTAPDKAKTAREAPSPDAPVDPRSRVIVPAQYQSPPEPLPPVGARPRVEETPSVHHLHVAHKALKITTSAMFVPTAVLGLFNALNLPTVFGDGHCATHDGQDIFNSVYGCNKGMSITHGLVGAATLALYTSEGIMGAVIPDDPTVWGYTGPRKTVRRAFHYVHLAGMIVTPAIGMASSFPQFLGAQNADEWPRIGRTIHLFTALVTAAAYWTTTAMEI